jgi:uncharacterized protein YbjT (DUF2867 family)
MKIVVMGGAGVVGSGVVERLSQESVQVVAASRRTGVDVITGAGLPEALIGADVVIDVTNSPSFEDEVAGRFFETASRNLLAGSVETGVAHYIAISIVGAERLRANGYFRAKAAQEQQVQAAGLPYTILRATQFYEFLPWIVRESDRGDEVRVSPARIQPIAAEDVAAALADIAQARPAGGIIEVAGPDGYRLDEIVRWFMSTTGDRRPVIADPAALYFGTPLTDETLIAGSTPRFGHTEFDRWLRRRAHEPAANLTLPSDQRHPQ